MIEYSYMALDVLDIRPLVDHAIPAALCRCDDLRRAVCACGDSSLCDTCDDTAYGQDANWVRINFARLQALDPALTNAEQVLSIGYANWVDSMVGVGLTNGLYRFTASFPSAPTETTWLHIGDYCVAVTNAGEYSFVLEKGLEYALSTLPHDGDVDYFAQDDLIEPGVMPTASVDWAVAQQWTRVGGFVDLVYPTSVARGRVGWCPVLSGSPDGLFQESIQHWMLCALLEDYRRRDVSYRWHSSNENVHFTSPRLSGTELLLDSSALAEEFSISVTVEFGGCELTSTLRYEPPRVAPNVVGIQIVDMAGLPIGWEYPVLVGESICVRVDTEEAYEDVAAFADAFEDFVLLDGIPLPLSENNVTMLGDRSFRIYVGSGWLQAFGVVRNTGNDGPSHTSIDMSSSYSGDSTRLDSDVFDLLAGGEMRGLARGTSVSSAETSPREGVFNQKTVNAAGTSEIWASCGAANSQSVQAQRQASQLYYSGHGHHNIASLNDGSTPETVGNYWRDVRTVIFAGCSVLDIGDQNGHYDENAGHDASPGLRWASVPGVTTLLGYNYKAPLDGQGSVDIIREWGNRRVYMGDVDAWMEANNNGAGRNACAIEVDGTIIRYTYVEELFWKRYALKTVIIER